MAYPNNFNPIGKTLKELADEYNVSVRTISNWKKDWNNQTQRPLTIDSLGALLRAKLASTVELVTEPVVKEPVDEEPTPGVIYKHTISPTAVYAVRVDGVNVDTVVVLATDNKYNEIVEAIKCNKPLDKFFVKEQLKLVPIATNNSVVIDEHGVKFKGFTIRGNLADAITTMYLDGRLKANDSMVLFLDNLTQNPDSRVFDQLYPFMKHNDIEISEDGCLLAYKKVRRDYYDIHSGTIRNAPGDKPSMPRAMVQNDPSQTCSTGLHVCAKSYLSNFGTDSDKVVIVKVNPKDVVSVPYDYDGAKMRVCEYEVLADA